MYFTIVLSPILGSGWQSFGKFKLSTVFRVEFHDNELPTDMYEL